MPNPGTFRGSRLAFLDSQAELYAEGVRNNQLADTVADIQRRYFKRFPMSLEHNVEPAEDWINGVDDSAPDADVVAPNSESLSNEAYTEAMKLHDKLVADTKARKDAIKRRLAYVYSKSLGKDSTVSGKGKKGAVDPLAALKARLAGVKVQTPRLRTPYNIWGPQHRDLVDPVFNKRVEDGGIPASQHIAVRSAVYKELFEQLPDEERQKYADIAKDEHDRAVEDIKRQGNGSKSLSNNDYQRAISALPSIVEPMLELLSDYTGWKFMIAAGGPEPADGGRLNMIFMHAGVAPGSVSIDFGSAEREAFKKQLIPALSRYMKRCYDKDACMSRALPPDHGKATLADVRTEEGFEMNIYRVEPEKAAPKKRPIDEEMERFNKAKGKQPPPTGTPSPQVRFGPPIGKKKNRVPPTKDNPSSLLPVPSDTSKSSPLAQEPITAGNLAIPSISTAEAASKPNTSTIPAAVNARASAENGNGAPSNLSTGVSVSAAGATVLAAGVATPFATDGPINTCAPASLGNETIRGASAPSSSGNVDASASVCHPPFNGANASSAAVVNADLEITVNSTERPNTNHPVSLLPSPMPSRAASPIISPGSETITSAHTPSSHLSTTSNVAAAHLSSIADVAKHVTGSIAEPPPRNTSLSVSLTAPPIPATTPSSESGIRNTTPKHVTGSIAEPPPRNTSLSVSLTAPPIPATTPLSESGIHNTTQVPSVQGPTPSDSASVPRAATRSSLQATKTAIPTPPGAATVPDFGDKPAEKTSNRLTKRPSSDSAELAHPGKKQRLHQRVFSVDLPRKAPLWVDKSLNLLASEDLGPSWHQLVQLWVLFEAKHGFDEKGKRLPSRGRPAVVAEWMKWGREPLWRRDIGDLEAYRAIFNTWWRSVQPGWRSSDGGTALIRGGGDWGQIRCPGPSGVLTALVALFFWKLSELEHRVKDGACDDAIADVTYVFENLISC